MMPNLYRNRIYPVLSRVEPEQAHQLALLGLRTVARLPGGQRLIERLDGPSDERLQVQALGLTFPNPLGVAAGLDKDASAVAPLLCLGFGAVEVGTVTPRPQPGNPSPRLWRFPDDDALINALGFPSRGAADVREQLVGQHFPGIVGINLGKNKETPAECAGQDYATVLQVLWDVADYVTINVSSPNTPGLRDLQRREALTALLHAVSNANRLSARLHRGSERPVLIKISPDLHDRELDEVLDVAIEGGAAGVIVSNTTTAREGLRPPVPDLPGGLSGRPLKARATRMTREVRRRVGRELVIIGVGGIASAEDVIERMRAGADLVQLYTGFIYGGPGLPAEILSGLLDFIQREGLKSIGEISGSGHP